MKVFENEENRNRENIKNEYKKGRKNKREKTLKSSEIGGIQKREREIGNKTKEKI